MDRFEWLFLAFFHQMFLAELKSTLVKTVTQRRTFIAELSEK